ncbi:hypothetical protein [Bradyrhizobium sp.]|uniref:hypothetical protein n=1 Tax=Bradyrhizobium sp. TaxID=376 RepID=UPI003C6713CA
MLAERDNQIEAASKRNYALNATGRKRAFLTRSYSRMSADELHVHVLDEHHRTPHRLAALNRPNLSMRLPGTLAKLNYGAFTSWWKQWSQNSVASTSKRHPRPHRRYPPHLSKAALSLVVRHARNSAASGGDTRSWMRRQRTRADLFIKTRQRIHAGRMLSDFAGGRPGHDGRAPPPHRPKCGAADRRANQSRF